MSVKGAHMLRLRSGLRSNGIACREYGVLSRAYRVDQQIKSTNVKPVKPPARKRSLKITHGLTQEFIKTQESPSDPRG